MSLFKNSFALMGQRYPLSVALFIKICLTLSNLLQFYSTWIEVSDEPQLHRFESIIILLAR